MQTDKKGSLVCVGAGIQVGAQTTPHSKKLIENADIVYFGLSDQIAIQWVKSLNSNTINLSQFYREGVSRHKTYQKTVNALVESVRAGLKVCGVFYGHPGVFALAPHKAIKIAKSEGYEAYMQAGISAEDCLYADLGIDPGKFGCQHYEATQFMINNNNIETSAYLILWQVGVTGDLYSKRLSTTDNYLTLLKEKLIKVYSTNHKAILYKASKYTFAKATIKECNFSDLTSTDLDLETTLVIPPANDAIKDEYMLQALSNIG